MRSLRSMRIMSFALPSQTLRRACDGQPRACRRPPPPRRREPAAWQSGGECVRGRRRTPSVRCGIFWLLASCVGRRRHIDVSSFCNHSRSENVFTLATTLQLAATVIFFVSVPKWTKKTVTSTVRFTVPHLLTNIFMICSTKINV